MCKYTRITAALLAAVLLAGCTGGGGDNVSVSESSEREVSTEVTTTEITTVPKTVDVTTSAPETEPPVTTVAKTTTTTAETTVVTTPEVTATTTVAPVPSPADGVTSKGYSITTVEGVTYVDGILIANKTYALPETYAPGGLTDETYAAFTKMQSAASAEGLYLFVKSGYRSFYDQRYIYNGYAESDGAAAADRYSARAGHSEHQSGMAIDVNSTASSFADTPEGVWLKNNCHKYGFIIRYPDGKEHITGYMYEPWHVRYVGVDLAGAVTDSGLCLEEYFGITSSYS